MRILTVVGARPQFIKAAVVSRHLRASPGIEEFLLHTGQHYDENMSGVFFDELKIPKPDLNLGVQASSHAAQTAEMLVGIENALIEQRPDLLLVYGDTNSTLAGALAAAKLHIPVAHIEAGLRSYNRQMPEEINRILTDHASEVLFSTSADATATLEKEGIGSDKIVEAGDVMFDATIYYASQSHEVSPAVAQLDLESKSYVLATVHRAENTDSTERLENVFDALIEVARSKRVVLPLHPRTKKALEQANLMDKVAEHLTLIPPVGYLDMIYLEQNAAAIATDSGGVQKEAYYFSVPCITLRDETEWTELITRGVNKLAKPSEPSIAIAQMILASVKEGMPKESGSKLYGGGLAGERICESLVQRFKR